MVLWCITVRFNNQILKCDDGSSLVIVTAHYIDKLLHREKLYRLHSDMCTGRHLVYSLTLDHTACSHKDLHAHSAHLSHKSIKHLWP